MSLTKEEEQILDTSRQLYRELQNAPLLQERLRDLREQFINRIARLDDEKTIWKELGKLWLVDHMLNFQKKTFQTIKRLEEESG